ncbi:MAG: glycoside hydrolase family 27 protein [Defluviitaleaceae bacterium]|nr:glycoside hydrolase family 27 protein [Defluviitaleaceae bacterium]
MDSNQNRNVAPTPPMGWNSWDCYAATVTEAQLMNNAQYMKDHLLAHGWNYIVCDIQWSEPGAGTGEWEYRPMARLDMDEWGRLIPAENRFPSSAGGKGFKPIADKIHGMGLKFGIHLMRGIPRQAAYERTPILGTHYTADQIANPFSVCKWNSDMYGVDHTKPGAQEYYDSLFALYASWDVDFVKIDDICNTNLHKETPYSAKHEIEMIRRAMDKCGRPMVLSLSPGPAVIEEAWHLKKHAEMWRMTDDFWDHWPLLLDMFRRCEVWQSHVAPGSWPDCDMLPLGHIGIGHKRPRYTNFTHHEQMTMMNLWCIFRSPLMMGGEMNDSDEWTLKLMTNDEVIAVNQAGSAPRQIVRENGYAIWVSDAPDGGLNLAIFNTSDHQKAVTCPADVLPQGQTIRDLWARENIGETNGDISVELAAHASVLYKIS